MSYAGPDTEILIGEDVDVLTDLEKSYNIIVWNDDVNTFEWVIETLIDICGHSEEQAEQCALLIHTKGKYGVQQGSYKDLKPKTEAIVDRGISATLEILTK
jgi:ATP-dependent Clp protease adaptor protein ClpS